MIYSQTILFKLASVYKDSAHTFNIKNYSTTFNYAKLQPWKWITFNKFQKHQTHKKWFIMCGWLMTSDVYMVLDYHNDGWWMIMIWHREYNRTLKRLLCCTLTEVLDTKKSWIQGKLESVIQNTYEQKFIKNIWFNLS